jgi:hypothetical protein
LTGVLRSSRTSNCGLAAVTCCIPANTPGLSAWPASQAHPHESSEATYRIGYVSSKPRKMNLITPAYWPNTPQDFAPDFGVSPELAAILVRSGVCVSICHGKAIRMVQPWRTDDPNAARFVRSIQSLIMGEHIMDAVAGDKEWAIVIARTWADNHAARPTPGTISRDRLRRMTTRRRREQPQAVKTMSPLQEGMHG